MECEKIRERFSSFLEKDLDPSEEREVREHVAACLPCSRDLEGLRKTLSRLHDFDELEVPDDFFSGIRKKMETPRKAPHPGPRWLGPTLSHKLPLQAAAMIAVVLIAVYVTKITSVKTIPPGREIPGQSQSPSEETKAKIALKEEAGKDVSGPRAPDPAPKTAPGRDEAREESRLGSPVSEDMTEGAGPVQKRTKAGELPKKQEEVTLKFANRDRTLSFLNELARRFNGEITGQEGDLLVVSLPQSGYDRFMQELGARSFQTRKDQMQSPGEAAGRPAVSPGVLGEQVSQKVGERELSTPGKEDRLVIRIHLLPE